MDIKDDFTGTGKIAYPRIPRELLDKKSLEDKIGRPVLLELAAGDYIHLRSQAGCNQ